MVRRMLDRASFGSAKVHKGRKGNDEEGRQLESYLGPVLQHSSSQTGHHDGFIMEMKRRNM
jgi:hypothetical protein